MNEKRDFLRYDISLPFGFSFEDNPISLRGAIKDISLKGIRVVVDESLEFLQEGHKFFYLFLPNKSLKVCGEIVWQKDHEDRREMGICFRHISQGHKEDICRYIFKYHQRESVQGWWQM